MKVYEGKMPYVFVSYAHKDIIVTKYVESIMRKQIRLWFDDGNHAGDDWAENIANHLLDSNVILLFISKESMASINVNNEIALALKYKKKIMPVYIEDVSLTPAMDIKIGSFHSINVFDKDFKGAVESIVNNIPKENFVQKTDPFFENEKWKLYLTEKEVSDRGVVSFSIAAKNDKEDKILFTYPQMGPFELNIRINKCEEIEDDFFNEEGNSSILLNISVSNWLFYPINGDDLDELLSFVIINPLTDDIKVVPICYKLISPKTNKYHPNLVTEEEYKEYFGNYISLKRKLDKLFYGIEDPKIDEPIKMY